ncbi:hypothetical protein BpHYR1_021247 [Brachionus plicatilis]|uniref:Uncharacterized protein n=1 Tax=Brachionus plicatilis TaxID=10195 RepID=A0A3M7T557_BRAPC|nr:hypothetical protein BpHYR1_021247 [Brachionus plicatilis]
MVKKNFNLIYLLTGYLIDVLKYDLGCNKVLNDHESDLIVLNFRSKVSELEEYFCRVRFLYNNKNT